MSALMTTVEDLTAALLAALADPEAAGALAGVLKHPGGRPLGARNKGPDKLERAVMALNVRRESMTPEEVKESEWRVNRFLEKRWPWKSRRMRRLLVARGVPEEELDVVVQYKRSEDRVGMSRVRRFKGAASTIGAGYDREVDEEPTEREIAGKVKRSRPPRRKRCVGYPTAPERIVESSLGEEPVVLWGMDVSRAVQEELGFEPVRGRKGGRRWLAPVNATEEFRIGSRTVVGAGDGRNGEEPLWDWEPTIGECRKVEIEKDRVRGGLPYEPDGRRVRLVVKPAQFEVGLCRRQQTVLIEFDRLNMERHRLACVDVDVACIEPKKLSDKDVEVVADKYRGPSRQVASLPRSEGESRTGRYTTRWRVADTEYWFKPVGMIPGPVPS